MALASRRSSQLQSTSQKPSEAVRDESPLASEVDSEDSEENGDYQGSLEGESEDEWAEERKAVRYMAESEIEEDGNSMSDDSSHKSDVSEKQTDRRKNRVQGMADGNEEADQGASESSEDDQVDSRYPATRKRIPTRGNKHAPIEISSKKAVTRKRTIVQVPKIERRDPRFDTLSGALNEDLHQRSFAFLTAQRRAELEKTREILLKAKKSGRQLAEIEKLEEALRREENREVQREKMDQERQALRAWKAAEREKRKQGKGAFYLKKTAQKQIVLADRYEHLSKNKFKLHKSIEKKRKKVDGKEKKSMPFSRQRRDPSHPTV